MNVRVRGSDGIQILAAQVAQGDLDILSGPLFAGRAVTSEEVNIVASLLAHDQYDRSYERFPLEYLQRFAETLPGKSMLASHSYGGSFGSPSLPLGRYFKAEVTSRQENAFPVPTRGYYRPRRSADAAPEPEGEKAASPDSPPGFDAKRRKVNWLKCHFYFPNHPSTEGLAANIDVGVYKWKSIGFRYDDIHCDLCKKSYLRSDCPHIFGWEEEDGKVATGTYAGDAQLAEAMEGSIVYLGCQPLARLEQQLREGAVDPKQLAATPLGEDLVTLKAAEGLARKFGHARKAWAFPSVEKVFHPPSPAPAGEQPSRGGDDKAPEAPGDSEMNWLERARKALGLPDTATEEEVVAALDALKSEHGKVKASGEKAAKLVVQVLNDLKTEYLADIARLGEKDTLPTMVADLCIEKRDYDQLKKLRDETREKVLATIPAGKSGAADPPADDDSEPRRLRSNDRDFALI